MILKFLKGGFLINVWPLFINISCRFKCYFPYKCNIGAPCGTRTHVGRLGGNCSIQLS